MALVHEKLYKSDDFSRVDMKGYITSMVSSLRSSFNGNKNIIIETHVNNLYLEINTAIPCGLIINETITNALKHAFINRESGHIDIKFLMQKPDHTYKLCIEDNGIGIDETKTGDDTESLGMKLIHILTSQIGGEVSIESRNGTRICIEFPLSQDAES